MGATIDSLDIQIATSVQKASNAIDTLIGKLGKLSTALNIDTSKLSNIGKNIDLSGISKQAKVISESVGNMGAKVAQSMKPIQEQAKKTEERLSQITEKYKDLGKGLTFSGNETAIQKQIDSYSNALEKAKLKKQELELSGKTEGQRYENAVKDVIKYQNVIEGLKNQLSSLNEQPKAEFVNIADLSETQFKEWLETLPAFKARAEEAANALKDIGTAAMESAREFTGAWNGVKLPTDLTIKTDLSKMTPVELDEWFNNLPTIKAQAEEMERTIEEVANASTGAAREFVGAWDGVKLPTDLISTKIKGLSDETKEFMEKLVQLEVPPIKEENLDKLRNSLSKTEEKLEELRIKLSNGLTMGAIKESADDSGYRRLQEQIALTEKQAEALRERINELGNVSGFDRFAQKLSNIPKAFESVSRAAAKLRTSLSGTLAMLKRLDGGIKGVTNKFLNFAKSLGQTSKSGKKAELSFSKLLKMTLRYGLGIRSVYALINKLRRAIIEGFGNLAQYSDRVNNSISMLKSSLGTFKNASAAAISPLLNAVAPALNTIIQLFIRATNAVNQFLSALFGNATWIKAKDVVEDYAAGIKKAGKEAQKSIRQFDELKIITTDQGGDDGTSAADMFETLPIESRFEGLAEKTKEIAEKLFAPIKEAWEKQGHFVMDSWKFALQEVGVLTKSISDDFLTIWNQPKTISMLENMLIIIGNIGLAVGHLAGNFRKAWEEGETGLNIFENIRDVFAAIIANIRSAADYTATWAQDIDFTALLSGFRDFTASLEPIADSLSGILSDFYTKVLLPLGKWTLEKGLPKLLDVFTEFNNKVDWTKLRENLAEFWEHLEPFAETVGEGLIIFIERVSDVVANFLNSETFVNFLHDAEEWMDNVEPEDVADSIEKLAKAFIALKAAIVGFAALTGFVTIIATIGKLLPLLGLLKDGFMGIVAFGGQVAEAFSLIAGGAGTVSEVLFAIFTPFQGIIALIGGTIVAIKNFVTMLKEGFSWLNEILMVVGIALAAIGVIILGIPAGIAAAVAGVVAAIATVAVVVKDNWDAIAGFFSNLWQNIIGVWQQATGWFSTNVVEPIVNFFVEFYERVKQVFEGLWIIIQAVWIVVSSWFNKNVIQPIVTLFTPIVGIISGFFSAAWSKIKTIWSVVSNWFEKNIIQPVTNAFRTACNVIGGFFSNLWNGIKQGVVAAMNAIIVGIENAINFIVKGINGLIGGFNKVVSWAAKITGDNWGGVDLISNISLGRINVQTYAVGGFPEDGWFRASHGEIMGQFDNGKSVVANNNQITEGISLAVQEGNRENNSLMRQEISLLQRQNDILIGILKKEFGITKTQIGEAAREYSKEFLDTKGYPAYAF